MRQYCSWVQSFSIAIASSAAVVHGQATTPPHPMPGRQPIPTTGPVRAWQLIVTRDGKRVAAHPVQIAEPDKPVVRNEAIVDLGPEGKLLLVEYVPHATVDFELRRGVAQGGTAIRLHVEGPGTRVDRWLIGSDLNHSALNSPLAKWSVLVAEDAQQIEQFVERKRKQKKPHNKVLMVSTHDGKAQQAFTEIEPGRTLKLDGTDVTVRILRYMPWCSYDLETKKIANVGDEPINPAIEVEVTTKGSRSKHLVFAQEDADRMHLAATGSPRPVRLRFHQATTRLTKIPAFTLFLLPSDEIRLVTALGDKVNAIGIQVGDLIGVPNSPFRFHVAERVPNARLAEHWKTKDQTVGQPAIKVRHEATDGRTREHWVAAASMKRIPLTSSAIELRFVPAHGRGAGLSASHPPTASDPSAPTSAPSHR